MSPRRQETNEAMRRESLQKISSAALRVFSLYGYHGATLKKITNETGLSYGLVYHYFSSKEKIFLHLVDLALKNSRQLMERAMERSGSAWQKIQYFSTILVEELKGEVLASHFAITQLAMTQATDIPGIDEFIAQRISHYALFDQLIEEAQKDGDIIQEKPEILSGAYLALVQGLALMAQHDKTLRQGLSAQVLNHLLMAK